MEIINLKKSAYEDYQDLLLRRDNLRKEAEQIHLEYLRIFGEDMRAVFEKKIECIKKKKKIARCQMLVNQGKKLISQEIDAYIDMVMGDYYQELENLCETLAHLQESRSISTYELKKIKEIYYRLAKRIHPDMRKDLANDETIMKLWSRIVMAYEHNQLKELQELEVLVDAYLKDNAMDLSELVEDIENKIVEVDEEIKEIISTNPYQYRFILEDEKALKVIKKELEMELENYITYGKQLDEVLANFVFEERYS